MVFAKYQKLKIFQKKIEFSLKLDWFSRMASIQILSDHLANQIAAGEVVERPGTVVKELIENSLDAKASKIEVSFKRGGKQYICVEDNGIGMTSEDSLLCFKRHATSKLSKIEDLSNILSFGFRGEAIPSIASVCRFRLRTRHESESEGSEILFDEGEMIYKRECGMPVGTKIQVEQIFKNVPARRKFLRADLTESIQIITFVKLYAIANPSVGFTLIEDDKIVFQLDSNQSFKERVKSLFASDVDWIFFKNGLASEDIDNFNPNFGDFEKIGFDSSNYPIKFSGVLSPSSYHKFSRQESFLFVNRRPIDNRSLKSSIFEAYRPFIPAGRFPVALIFVEISPELIDVNVHPTKKEILFKDESAVKSLFQKTLFDILQKSTKNFAEKLFSTHSIDKQLIDKVKNRLDRISEEVPGVSKPEIESVYNSYQKLSQNTERINTSEDHKNVSFGHVDSFLSPISNPGAFGLPIVSKKHRIEDNNFSLNSENFAEKDQNSLLHSEKDRNISPEIKEHVCEKSEQQKDAHNIHEMDLKDIQSFEKNSSDENDENFNSLANSGLLIDKILWQEKDEMIPEDNFSSHNNSRPSGSFSYQEKHKISLFSKINWRFLGFIKNKYAIFESANGIILFNCKAAKQRILYDNIIKSFSENSNIQSQLVLMPTLLDLNSINSKILTQYIPFLQKNLGLVIQSFGRNSFRIEGVPNWLEKEQEKDFVEDFLSLAKQDNLLANQENLSENIDKNMHKIALAATKHVSSDVLSYEKCLSIVDKLMNCENPINCPRGFQIFCEINTNEIERRLGKTYVSKTLI